MLPRSCSLSERNKKEQSTVGFRFGISVMRAQLLTFSSTLYRSLRTRMMASFVNLVICGAIVIGFWREIVKTGVHYSYPMDRVYFVAIF